MNFPNFLTLSRFVLAIVFLVFLFIDGLGFKVAAFATFALACLTDYWDGIWARKHNQITAFGQILDPIADKFLTFSAFLAFVNMRILPAWVVVVMLVREVFITFFRFLGASKGLTMSAEHSGKVKTVLQIGVILCILAFIILTQTPYWNPAWSEVSLTVIRSAVICVMVFTLWSGIRYAVKHWKEVSEAISR